jgi:hypothetical protein
MNFGRRVAVSESTRRLAPWLSVVAVVAFASWLPACHHGAARVSNDPGAPVYRNPSADLSKYRGVAVHFVSVTTSNNEGVDLTRSVFLENLKSTLAPRFGEVNEGAAAPAGGLVVDVSLLVNWGSRAARVIVGMGAGRAGIQIDYDLKDANGAVVASLHTTDSMAGGFAGGDAKQLVFAAASKWNRYFADEVLR